LDHIQIVEVVDKSCLVLEYLVAHVDYDVNWNSFSIIWYTN
jgi:hypothetical protein